MTEKHKKRTSKKHNKKRGLTKKQERKVRTAVFFVILIVFAAIALGPRITGFAVISQESRDYLDVDFFESRQITWTPANQNYSEITSIKLSGTFQGTGNAKVYLVSKDDEFLIFDSNEIEEEKQLGLEAITGFAITNQTQEENVSEGCGSCEEELVAEEPITEENITEELPPEENITLPEENTTLPEDNVTLPLENITNITIPENVTNVTEVNITVSENITEEVNVTEPNITFPIENITNITTIPEEPNITLPLELEFAFQDICLDTCALNLTDKNFTLKVMINNSTLYIDTISYATKLWVAFQENITNKTEELIQHQAIINEPVKWKKSIKLNQSSENVRVSLLKEADNIQVREILENREVEYEPFVREATGLFGAAAEKEEKEILIKDKVKELEVEFETPAPTAIETELENGKKQITISSDLHYENILAYSDLPEVPMEAVELWHIVNGSRVAESFEPIDSNDNGLIDRIQWIVPHLSNQTYEIMITILNIQSYPSLYGNWTVNFNTTGQADLRITAVNGTNWTNYADSGYDLKFLEVRCGDTVQSYNWTNSSVFIPNYTCTDLGYETSKVLIPRKHALEFDFGGVKAYAYNDVVSGWYTENGEVTMDATTDPVDLSIPVNTSRAFILLRNRDEDSQYPDDLGVYAAWVNSTRFNLIQDSGSTGDSEVVWQVIEGADIWVQNGTQTYTSAQTSFDITISSVDVSKTVVFMTEGSCDSTTNSHMNEVFWTGNLTGPTTLHIQRDDSGNCDGTVAYFVAEFNDGSTVYQGQIPDVGNPSYANLPAVINESNTWFYFSKAGTAANLDRNYIRARHYNDTAFAVSVRDTASGNRINWYAVSTPGAVVQNGTTNMDSSISTTETISTVVVNRSFSIDSCDNSGGGSAQDNARSTSQVTGTTSVAIKRGTTGNSEDVSWQVVQLPEPPASEPNITSLVLNSTLTTNTTDENLTCYAEGNNSKSIIFNWKKDNQDLAFVNMPFDTDAWGTTVKDYAGYDDNGTETSSPQWVTDCKIGACYNLTSEYIDLGSALSEIDVSKPLTIMGWAKSDNPGETGSDVLFTNIHASNNRFSITQKQNTLRAGFYNGASFVYCKSGTVNDNNWHHFAYTFDGSSTGRLWIDGSEVSGTNTPSTIATTGCIIGARSDIDKYYDGMVDQFRIYNFTLNESQIKAIYEFENSAGLHNQSRIVSQETGSPGENWTCEAWASGGSSESDMENATLEIRLLPPKDVYSISLNQPTSNPDIYETETFSINCTPITGGSSSGVNISFMYNSTDFAFKEIETSGSVNLTTSDINPVVDVLNDTMYNITVTGHTIGVYNVMCKLYNGTAEVNSSVQEVTVSSSSRALYNITLNQPTSDPDIVISGSFYMNCTPETNDAPDGINISFMYNSTDFAFKEIETSGSVNLTTSDINPVVDVLNDTIYNITVTGHTIGVYNVMCKLYNGTAEINSSTQDVTVNPPSRAVYNVNLDEPTSDPDILEDSSFSINCTPEMGDAVDGVNISIQYNSSEFSWTEVPTSGNVNLTINTNPHVDVINNTMYNATITGQGGGTYNVRCRLYNSTDSVYSAPQEVTVTPMDRAIYSVNLDEPNSDLYLNVSQSFSMNCTPEMGDATNGVNISLQYNSTRFGWTDIPTSGSVNFVSTLNPVADVTNNTAYNATINTYTEDEYNVRCRLYNSTDSVYSGTQMINVSPSGDKTVYNIIINDPVTDPRIFENDSFSFNCTPQTGGATSGVNIQFMYNSSDFGWKFLETSGSVNMTATGNSVSDVLSNAMYNVTVTGWTADNYFIKCRLYNGTGEVNSTPQQVRVFKEPDDWPSPAKDPYNTADVNPDDLPGPATNNTLWNVSGIGDPRYGFAIVDGVVYTMTRDTDTAYAYDVYNGTQLWSTSLPSGSQKIGGVSYYNDIVIFPTEKSGASYTASTVWGLNATSGSILWSFNGSAGEFRFSGTIKDDKYFIGSREASSGGSNPDFYIINATNGSEICHYDSDISGDSQFGNAIPVIYDGLVAFYAYGAATIIAINETNCTKKWSTAITGFGGACESALGPIKYEDDLLYKSMDCSGVVKLNATTGNQIEYYDYGGSYITKGVQMDDHFFYLLDWLSSSGAKYVRAVNKTNLSANNGGWTLQFGSGTEGSRTASSPMYGDTFYFATYTDSGPGVMRAINVTSQALVWNYTFTSADGIPARSAIIAQYDGIVVVSTDGGIYAFADPSYPQAANVRIESDDIWDGKNGNLTGKFDFQANRQRDSMKEYETLWFKDNVSQSSLINKTWIDYRNTTRYEAWIFSVRVYDGTTWSNWTNSSDFLIKNIPPAGPTNLTPTSGLWGGPHNQTIPVNCTGSTDQDGDSVTYYIESHHWGSWGSIRQDDADGYYEWDISGEDTSFNFPLRCKAKDSQGDFSGNYEPPMAISIDNDGPFWSNVQKNETNVQIGMKVNFSADWTETSSSAAGLAGFIFATNQSGSWVNSSYVEFSGVSAVSSNITEITGSGNVSWYFWANDTLGNANQTEIQTFEVGGNAVPEAVNVTITSDSEYNDTLGNLTGSFNFSDADQGASIQANETMWFNNTVRVSSLDNLTWIDYRNTTRYENWTFSVRVSDGIDWSSWTNSSNFTIQNSPGRAVNLTITSDDDPENKTTGNLTGSFDFSDVEGDSIQANETKWYKPYSDPPDDTEDQYHCQGSFASSCADAVDENWSSYARANANGTAFVYENYTLPSGVANATWTFKFFMNTTDLYKEVKFNISVWDYSSGSWDYIYQYSQSSKGSWMVSTSTAVSSGALNGSVLQVRTALYAYSDIAETIYVDYYEGNATFGYSEIASLRNKTYIDYGNTSSGETWIFSARVHDGVEWGPWANSSGFVIENTAPQAPTSLAPTSGTWGGVNDTIPLNCSGATDADSDDDLKYTIESNYLGSWGNIVTGDADGYFEWNISEENSSFDFDLKCKVHDGTTFSPDYDPAVSISIDNDGPFWSNVQKNETTVYQNSIVGFNTTWTENAQTNLSGYIFATNDTGSWVNSSYTEFSGDENVSVNITKITAPSDSKVSWYFWANDTLGNANQTAIQTFTIANIPPEPVNVSISSDDSDNRTFGNLTGTFDYTDADEDSIQANETLWFKDDTEQSNLKNKTWIDYRNTSKGETWIFSVRVFDGDDWSSWVNSSGFLIENTPPTTPTTLTPTSGLWGGNNNTIPINCSGSTDSDEDDVDYNIQSNATGAWTSVVDADEDGYYEWDISSEDTVFGFWLRCNATDGTDSSSWYQPSANLGIDNDGPFWANPAKNESTVYQNTFVEFNTSWTEDAQTNLSGYVFIINQSDDWVNSSYTEFSGNENTSTNTSYITASPGTNVSWYFWANDTLGNSNQTAVQSFILGNNAPEAVNLTITSDDDPENKTTGNLTGSFDFSDEDPGASIEANETMWFKNDAEQTDLKNKTWIDYRNTTKGETWIFSVRVYDGISWGAWANSSGFAIENTLPTTPTNLTPTSGVWGGNNDTIPINCSGATDPDSGDSVTYYIESNLWGSWGSVVNNDADGYYEWDISGEDSSFDFGLRCKAYDGTGYSGTYTPAISLNVDNDGPFWANPAKNESSVVQNMNVEFNATWTEDSQTNLSGYVFIINQSDDWVNSSYIPFTGAENVSVNVTQITASGGTNVTWYFWANDTLGNANQTSIQSFVVGTKSISIAISDALSSGITWTIDELPATRANATGNNDAGNTDYNVSISASGTTVDLFIKADGNLTTGVYDIALENEEYYFNTTQASVPVYSYFIMTDEYYNETHNNTFGLALPDGSASHLKFFLTVPSSQDVGVYSNNVSIIGIEHGSLP